MRARAPALFCAIPTLHFSTVFRHLSVTGAESNKTSLEHLSIAQSTHHSPRDRLRSHRCPHANLHVEIFQLPQLRAILGIPSFIKSLSQVATDEGSQQLVRAELVLGSKEVQFHGKL